MGKEMVHGEMMGGMGKEMVHGEMMGGNGQRDGTW